MIVAAIIHHAFKRLDRQDNKFFVCKPVLTGSFLLLIQCVLKGDNQRIGPVFPLKRKQFVRALSGVLVKPLSLCHLCFLRGSKD